MSPIGLVKNAQALLERDMKTQHMELRMAQRGIDDEIVALAMKYGEFNNRGDRIILSRKIIARLLESSAQANGERISRH